MLAVTVRCCLLLQGKAVQSMPGIEAFVYSFLPHSLFPFIIHRMETIGIISQIFLTSFSIAALPRQNPTRAQSAVNIWSVVFFVAVQQNWLFFSCVRPAQAGPGLQSPPHHPGTAGLFRQRLTQNIALRSSCRSAVVEEMTLEERVLTSPTH